MSEHIADLAALAKLREPFPPEAISKLPKGKEDKSKRQSCRVCKGYHDPSMIHLDYVGHAAITDRLLTVDPEWTWEPVAYDANGAPLLDRAGNGAPVGLWIKLTVAGMTRLGYGSVEPGKNEAVKELIGDALRNAGMRFGMALDLWHKGDLPDHDAEPAPVVLDDLDGLIAEARSKGVTGDYDSLRAWASESPDNVKAAESKLRKALLAADDSPADGDEGGDADPSAGATTSDAPPASEPAGEGTADQADAPFDWQAHARDLGLTKLDVMNGLRSSWEKLRPQFAPDDGKKLAPNKSSEIDGWAAGYPELIRDVIDGLAEAKAGAA